MWPDLGWEICHNNWCVQSLEWLIVGYVPPICQVFYTKTGTSSYISSGLFGEHLVVQSRCRSRGRNGEILCTRYNDSRVRDQGSWYNSDVGGWRGGRGDKWKKIHGSLLKLPVPAANVCFRTREFEFYSIYRITYIHEILTRFLNFSMQVSSEDFKLSAYLFR